MPNDPLSRPILILGAPRSGTSILSSLLKHHPQLAFANEPRVLWKLGNERRSDLLRPEHATPAVRETIRGRFAKLVVDQGKERLLEKTPSNSLRVGFLDKIFEDAIVVHIVRDGLSSVLSIREFWRGASKGFSVSGEKKVLWRRLKEMGPRQIPHYAGEFAQRVAAKALPKGKVQPPWGPRLPGLKQMAKDLDLLEVCAMQWRACIEMGMTEGRKLPADRYTECQLNSFDRDELVKIMEFCGLPVADEVLQAYDQRYDASAPGKRATQFPPEDIARVEEYIAPTVTWLNTLEPLRRH